VQVIAQTLDQILASLRPLSVEWQDEVAQRLIERLKGFPIKTEYTESDVSDVLNGGSKTECCSSGCSSASQRINFLLC
jgi:hypothetical protein